MNDVLDARNGPSFALYVGLLFVGLNSLRVVAINYRYGSVSGAPATGTGRGRRTSSAVHELMVSGLALLILPFLPASNLLVTVGFTVAERVMYLPSMGFCVLAAMAFHCIGHRAVVATSSAGEECALMSDGGRRRLHHGQSVCSRWCSLALLAVLTCYGTRTYMRTADWDTELALLDAGIWAYPSNPKLFSNLAIAAYSQKNDLRRSVKAADWSLLLKPDIHTSFTMRGLVFKDLGLLDQAEHDFRRAIEISPNSEPSAYTNLGITRVQQANAMIAERSAASTGRNDLQVVRMSRAELMAAGDSFSRAERVAIEERLQEGLRFAGSNPKVMRAIADAYLRVGKPSMALFVLRSLQRLEPRTPNVSELVAWLEEKLR